MNDSQKASRKRLKVAEDPALSTEEKETVVRFAKDEDRLTVHSEQAAVVRWLQRHPDYEENDRRVKEGVLHATTGTLPVGALKLSGHPRESSNPSDVVGTLPEEAEA